MDLSAILAQRMQLPAMVRPDIPPGGFKPGRPQGPTHPTRFETRKVNGKWVLVPVAFKPGKADPRLRPKVSYTPLP
jgi:hypothetical protein